MRALLVLAGVLGLVVGCASNTLDVDLCRNGNWEKIGWIDGREGRLLKHLEAHQKSCQGTSSVDAVAYERGWQSGRAEYCTPENIFQVGALGQYYMPIVLSGKS